MREHRKGWPWAVAASLLLHALILMAFRHAAGTSASDAQAANSTISLGMLDVEREPSPNDMGPGSQGAQLAWPPLAQPDEVAVSTPVAIITTQPDDQPPLAGTGAANAPKSGSTGGAFGGPTGTLFAGNVGDDQIVYVIDCSASMGKNGALRKACAELLARLTQLREGTRFQIVVYNNQARTLLPSQPGWLKIDSQTLDRTRTALELLPAEGETQHNAALRLAFSLQPQVVYFLTDADDLTVEHLRLVSQLNKLGAQVNTIELTTWNRGNTTMPMQVLAAANRGTYQAIDLMAIQASD